MRCCNIQEGHWLKKWNHLASIIWIPPSRLSLSICKAKYGVDFHLSYTLPGPFLMNLWLITRSVTRLTRRVSLMEQELLTLPENLSSPPVFSDVRVTRSLVLCVCSVYRCLSFCTFSLGHCTCVVCSSTYGFWLPLWYLQALLMIACIKMAGIYVMYGSFNRKLFNKRLTAFM